MIRVAGAVVLLAAVVAGVLVLRETTETRHTAMPGDSTLVVEASARVRGPADRRVLATAQVEVCVVEARTSARIVELAVGDDGDVRFVVRPAFDKPDRRQLRGCIEDLRLPGLIMDVRGMQVVGAPAAG